jgi:hypothetical protein
MGLQTDQYISSAPVIMHKWTGPAFLEPDYCYTCDYKEYPFGSNTKLLPSSEAMYMILKLLFCILGINLSVPYPPDSYYRI